MMLVCIAMYATATAHLVISARTLISEQQFARELLDFTTSCLSSQNATLCSSENIQHLQDPPPGQVDPSIPTALLSVNVSCIIPMNRPADDSLLFQIVLGDSIVLWRAWILWARNRVLQLISLSLIISTTGSNQLRTRVVGILTDVIVTSSLCSSTAGTAAEGMWGMAAFALSWATNMWSTGLISCKAWYATSDDQYARVGRLMNC